MDSFTITILDQKLNVRFLHPNEKAVICFINDGVEEFKGVAKCNYEAGDEYDPGVGEGYALSAAIAKRNRFYERIIMKVEEFLYKKIATQEGAIYKHYRSKSEKLKKKEDYSEYKNAQDENPPIESYQNICLMGK
jgi:hypothetical protein